MSEKLRKRMEELEISVPELSKRTGVTKQAIYTILRGEIKKCRISTYKRLAKGLSCNVSDLID